MQRYFYRPNWERVPGLVEPEADDDHGISNRHQPGAKVWLVTADEGNVTWPVESTPVPPHRTPGRGRPSRSTRGHHCLVVQSGKLDCCQGNRMWR